MVQKRFPLLFSGRQQMADTRQVLIIHGWSDDSKSFEPLADFLEKQGYSPRSLWLGDYISLDDDVRIEDVAKRLHEVVSLQIASRKLSPQFDMIVHSTGGLVARRWISSYYPDGRDQHAAPCPVQRLLMLAPANFGSPLALQGQSMLGRLVKGWKNWFHTGREMLRALEPGSQFQWDLAAADLFNSPGSRGGTPYGSQKVMPFVITGTHPYTEQLRKILNENGSDGTVRVPAANLNARGITIDFAADESNPVKNAWEPKHGDLMFPFAVLPDRTHSSVLNPETNELNSSAALAGRLGTLIKDALECPPTAAKYSEIANRWQAISEETATFTDEGCRVSAGLSDSHTAYYHQYMQVLVRVTDDHGADVDDYFL
jgi:pimeloyl-ACP methyl ester carboxylesterase